MCGWICLNSKTKGSLHIGIYKKELLQQAVRARGSSFSCNTTAGLFCSEGLHFFPLKIDEARQKEQ